MSTWVAIPLGVVVLAFTWTSVLFTLVLPRAQWGPGRLSVSVNRATRATLMAVSRLTKTYERKDAVLALVGPIAVLAQLALWLALFGAAFVIMLLPYAHNFGRATSQVGAAMFTLGLARSVSGTNDTIVILAAASGFVVIALQIAYLPSLYAAFNRREALITMLAGRAGEPSWGPEILIRHQLVGIGDALPDFYASWEQWAAEFSESHASYPVLLLFRSPDPWSSWVLALLSVLDAAAMQLALNPTTTPSQARLCLRMGYTALRRISDALGWDFDADPLPDGPLQLSAQEFGSAVTLLRESGYEIERDSDAAWPHFRGWRVNYEDLAYRWADRLLAPPAPWSGTRSRLDRQDVTPVRPPHRSPDNEPSYRRPEFPRDA
ncbi:MAG: hypothetical protein ACLPVY_10995 [Acidimicrobiia bacterium]